MALLLGKSKKSVRAYRGKLKLRAVKPPGWAKGGDRRRRQGRQRCLNCDSLCPVATVNHSLAGWKRWYVGSSNYVYFCRRCVSSHGEPVGVEDFPSQEGQCP